MIWFLLDYPGLAIGFFLICFSGFGLFLIWRAARDLHEDRELARVSGAFRQHVKRPFGKTGKPIGALTAKLTQPPYKIFTTEFDAEISAEQLGLEACEKAERWSQVKEDFKTEAATNDVALLENSAFSSDRSLLVTLLIDHSGSLRGHLSRDVALAIDQAARALSKAQIPFEILGFTTRAWRGGFSKHKWQLQGEPENPGRLSDLLHIIYKNAVQDYADVSDSLALILADQVKRENIDGEAILWAHHRFVESGKQRWLCIVVSDGAPADDATLPNNGKTYLADHLKLVLSQLSETSRKRIVGFCIGAEPSQFYPDQVTCKNVAALRSIFADKVLAIAADLVQAGETQNM